MEPNKLREELKDFVNQGNNKFIFTMQNGNKEKLRLFISYNGDLCFFGHRMRRFGYALSDDFLQRVQSYKVLKKKKTYEQSGQGSSDVDRYIRKVIEWKEYVLKHHIDGVWEKLKKKAESITDDKLVAIKLLCSNEENNVWKIVEVAHQIGLPIVSVTATTLRLKKCPKDIQEKITKAIEEKESFDFNWSLRYAGRYSDLDVRVKGRRYEDDYRMWVLIGNEIASTQYYLLDYNHMLTINDDNDVFKE